MYLVDYSHAELFKYPIIFCVTGMLSIYFSILHLWHTTAKFYLTILISLFICCVFDIELFRSRRQAVIYLLNVRCCFEYPKVSLKQIKCKNLYLYNDLNVWRQWQLSFSEIQAEPAIRLI